MEEIKLSIPEGCKVVTVKVDGCKVTTEFEPEWNPQDGDFLTDIVLGTIVIYAGTTDYGGIITYAKSFGILQEKLDVKKGCGLGLTRTFRYATKEEKSKLLDKLESEGYRWNPEKKELERLPRWRAERLRGYFFISEDTLEVKFEKEVFDEVDDARYEAMNYFKTEEAANRVAVQIREIFNNSKAE